MRSLPNDWQVKTFDEIFELKQGKHLPLEELNGGAYPVFGANGMVGYYDKFMYERETLLVTCRGAICGSINLTKPNSWVTGNAIALVPKEEVVNPFFYFQLKHQSFRDVISGSAQPQIIVGSLKNKKVFVPPLPIQKQIAEILEKADKAKQKRKEANKLTDEFLQSVFIEMFGDPVKNPNGWGVKKFGSIFLSIRYGTGSPPAYVENGIPFIRATNIKNNSIVKNDLVFISSEEASKIKKCELREGNLLVVRSGVNTGDAAVVPKAFDRAYAAYDLIIELEITHSIFYSLLINSKYGKTIIAPLSRRAGQPHLNAEQLREIEFYFPPLSLQQQFTEIVNKTEALKEKQKQSEQVLENLFQSLMQKAFKGELVS
jgi:type I restriction enzyme S subunit